MADAITEFYDGHPYPPPVSDLDRYRERWSDPTRRRADHHLHWPFRQYREDLTVLIAGCGTSQAAKHAIRRPDARVVGIDVAASSVEHTNRLKDRYGLDNLEVRQMAIEEIDGLGEDFDLIVCTGVLHHLADPRAGLVALNSVMKPEAALHLMVYATYGRTGIYMIQEYARLLGVEPTDESVGDLMGTLGAVPAGHPLKHLLRSPDFRKADAVADALLNPRDRSYTVPEVFDLLAGIGLVFGRWHRQAPYLPWCGAIAATPHAQRLQELDPEAQYSAVELLRGTMARHSLIAYSGESWAGLADGVIGNAVPIRLPSTLAVQERLPEGAAAVLLNREHQYPDLILPVDQREFDMYGLIDGARSTSEIALQAGVALDGAVAFARRLWEYDQIVLDASGSVI